MASAKKAGLVVLFLVILGGAITAAILILRVGGDEVAVARALDAQTQAAYSEDLEERVDFLGRLDGEGRLTAPERERFYQQMVKPIMSIRSAIHSGDPIAGVVSIPV